MARALLPHGDQFFGNGRMERHSGVEVGLGRLQLDSNAEHLGQLAGPDVYSQARQILDSFRVMLQSVGSDLSHIVHVNVFLKDMRDFEEMNRAYVESMGDHRPARTVIGVRELPKPGVLLTMNLAAVTSED